MILGKEIPVLSVVLVVALLAGLSVAGVFVSGMNQEMTVEVTNTTIKSGEQGIVTVVAENVGSITPLDKAKGGVVLRTDRATFDPPPDQIQQSDPPNWIWAEPKDPLNNPVDKVSVRIPVETTKNAESGTYRFRFSVGKGSRSNQKTIFTVSVTVSRDDQT
ncbi:MAG: hypothetical protein ABEI99_08965 [Halobaculum sp.]